MTALTFTAARSGGWLAIAADDRLLVLATPADADCVDELFTAISDPAGFQLALDVLTRRGLAATPPFLLVERSDAATTRVIVRGVASAVVVGADGEHELSGAGVSTWEERTIPGFAGLTVDVPGAEPAQAGMLPLGRGAVWVSSIRMLADGAAVPRAQRAAAAQAPQPAVPTPASPVPTPVAPTAISETTVTDALSSFDETDANGYAHLFGATMVRSVAQAAVQPHDDDPRPESAAAGEGDKAAGADDQPAGDHDGHTVMTADIAKLRAGRDRGATPAATAVERTAFVLELSTGAREPLDQPILLGRSPSVNQVSGVRMPRLVTVGDVDQDISRNHAQFVLEGDTVVVTDLHSRNGTLVRLPGKEQQKLRAGEPTAILLGTVVDFGSGITLTVGEA